MGIFHSSLKSEIEQVQELLVLYQAVYSKFPDAQVLTSGFKSKTVNVHFEHYSFNCNAYFLSVKLWTTIPFTYNGKTQTIEVSSNPSIIEIAKKQRTKSSIGKTPEYEIVFSNLGREINKYIFLDKLLKETQIHISKFIQNNSNCSINTKYLDPKFKQLLSFI